MNASSKPPHRGSPRRQSNQRIDVDEVEDVRRSDLGDFARLGQNFLKRTVFTGLETLKEISDTIPKDAGQLIAKSKDEFIRNFFSREVLEMISKVAVDRFLARAKDYRLDVSIHLKRNEPPKKEGK